MLAVAGLGVPLGASLADRVDAEVRSDARGQADVVAASAADLLARPDRGVLQRLVANAGGSVRGRVIVVDARGRLLADSQGAPPGRDYSTRPEIRAALDGSADQRERRSETLDERLLATSVPVLSRGQPVGAVRVTQSVDAVDRAVRRAWLGLALVGLLVVAVGLAAGWLIANWVAGPTVRLDQAARRVAEGDLDVRAKEEGSAEQRSLARTFNEMTARIGRLLESQREFVADASHQLRTPLAGLRLRLEAAAADGDPDGELAAAQHEVDRLAQMVAELLELSRAGERELPGERLDLGDAAHRALARWEPAAHGRLRAEGEGAAVLCARADLDRIVDALVENALHYGDGKVTIAVRDRTLRVLDEGPGLDAGEEEVVFERFHRGSAGRGTAAGTGLGLAIARELARRWGADVTLRNRDDGLGAVAELRFTDPLPGTP
ncbi:MAG TPA: ATP-binding protein [Solirubrobacteraceae bacterium]|nr:ATP-binding protein [Solirubrobacteraceae bacterium]